MTNVAPINPREFIESVEPLLEQKDFSGLLTLLRSRWSPDQIKNVLCCSNPDARKVATLAIGLVGPKCSIPLLVQRLQDIDPMANEMAEYALWSIWFRCGNDDANCKLTRGVAALGRRDYAEASQLFTAAIESDPTFAEAYNQIAIVHYLQEQYTESIAFCRQAVDRMSCHFGAWAGMGHCHAHLGELREAIDCYQKALEINPQLKCLAGAIDDMRQHLKDAE